jgi:hypothetical protein
MLFNRAKVFLPLQASSVCFFLKTNGFVGEYTNIMDPKEVGPTVAPGFLKKKSFFFS